MMHYLFHPSGLTNSVISAAYLFIGWRLASAAVDKESRGFARWAVLSLASVSFLFGIGRYLYGQGQETHWIFFLAHALMIQHGFLTIRTTRLSREHARKLQAENDALKGIP